MAIFQCKRCGGDLEVLEDMSVAKCQYCNTMQTLPRLDNDKKVTLYDRANHFRRNNEFDKAMGIYEQILNEDNTDAESYWLLVLCRYGIEYVEDPASRQRVPTVNRAQFTSVFDDENYKSALQYADSHQKSIYEDEAKAINEIQKGILAISQQEDPFDVFICYKETDNNGRRTPDSVLANDLYHQLTQEGFKVFFARITLEDKLGTAYEPYIFAALNSAKVMVVLGTKPEYFNAVWVKNEWSRYLALIKSGAQKILIPAYKDMDPYDLPEEFAHLQSQDMSKLGFMQDLIRGIKKIVRADEPKTVIQETVVHESKTDVATLLKRASLFLQDGDWKSANEYCEKVLDIDPECAEAYLYKLMAEMRVKIESDIGTDMGTLQHNNNYSKIMLFGDDALKAKLEEYDNSCKYNYAVSVLNDHNYESAKILFEQLHGYKDSKNRIDECAQKIAQEKAEKDRQRRKLEELKRENAQVEEKKRSLNKKIAKISRLSILYPLLMPVPVVLIWNAITKDNAEGLLVPGLLTIPLFIVGIIGIMSSEKKKSAIKLQLAAIDQAAQEGAKMISDFESTKPLIDTFPMVGVSSVADNNHVSQQPAPNSTANLCDVILLNTGVNKIQVIAAIREFTGLDLAGAKNLTDYLPSTIKRAITVDEAKQIKNRLEAVGAQVDIR